jgi:hypothetical protein
MSLVQNEIQNVSSGVGNGLARVKNSKSKSSPPAPTDFVSTWKTDNTSTGSSANNQVRLPLMSTGTYNMTVYWGDGNSDIITVWNQAETTHTYSSIGTYAIRISGTFQGLDFAPLGSSTSTDRLKILSVSRWGVFRPINPSTGGGVFRNCANLSLTSVADVLNFSLATSATGMFGGCNSITTINLANLWDVSTITNISSMFFMSANNTNFVQDVTPWDVSNVANFSSMFQNCTAFNQNIGVWDVGSGSSFVSMLRSCTAFNQNIGSWNVSNASSFSNFMTGKTNADFSASNLDAIYNGWSLLTFVNSGLTLGFGTIKYTVASSAGRAILTSAPNNFTIVDGGI